MTLIEYRSGLISLLPRCEPAPRLRDEHTLPVVANCNHFEVRTFSLGQSESEFVSTSDEAVPILRMS